MSQPMTASQIMVRAFWEALARGVAEADGSDLNMWAPPAWKPDGSQEQQESERCMRHAVEALSRAAPALFVPGTFEQIFLDRPQPRGRLVPTFLYPETGGRRSEQGWADYSRVRCYSAEFVRWHRQRCKRGHPFHLRNRAVQSAHLCVVPLLDVRDGHRELAKYFVWRVPAALHRGAHRACVESNVRDVLRHHFH